LHGSFLRALLWALVLPLLALLVSIIPVLITSSGRVFLEGLLSNPTVQEQIGAHGWLGLAGQIAALRILNPWVYLLLVVLVAWAFALLRRGRPQPTGSNDFEPSTTFVLLILLVGLLLPLAVEFVYLRDTFGTRMNTVFKFYYQAWVLLAIAAAYGLHFISGQRSAIGGWRWTWLVGSIVLTIAASYYPFAAGFTRANNFIGPPTLDGIAWIRQTRPDDYAAIQWLRANVRGSPVILEAPGGSYTDYGRVSEATGLPTVVGWGGHELQWRGSGDEAGRRESEVEMIYTSLDEPQVVGLLEKYSVRYVYVGPLEQGRYDAAGLAKFAHFMDVVYDHDGVTIYRR
jgi:YYY domain-containing protein